MRLGRALASLAVLGLGCGPLVEPDEAGSGASTGVVAEDGTSIGAPAASSSDSDSNDGGDGSTTAAPDPGGYEEDDGGTGCTFTCPDPTPPAPPPGGGGWCGIECPRGEKCMPWANDGGQTWNAWRCSPLASRPGAPGDPCEVEGSQHSGIDDCQADALCWNVDPETNHGVCQAVCGLLESGAYECEEPLGCALVDGTVPLCVHTCDPVAPDCAAGEACTFLGPTLACQPIFGRAVPVGQPCGPEAACEAGTLCSFDLALDCGNEPGVGCCAVPCDVDDPVACTGAETCVPWFPIRPPPELAYLGVCAPV